MATPGVLGRAFIQVYADLTSFQPSLKKELDESLAKVAKDADFKPLEEEFDKAGHEAGAALGKGLEDEVDKELEPKSKAAGKKTGGGFLAGFGGVMRGIGVSFLPVLIALGVESAAALLPAVYALGAAIPAAITVAAASLGVLMAAFHGVSAGIAAAFSNNPAKMAAALKKLAPAARDFVTQLASMRPLLHGLQQDIQQAFFVQLEGSLKRTLTTLLPAVHGGLVQLSTDLGKMGRGLISSLGSSGNVANFQSIFLNADLAIKPLIPALGKLAGAFLTVAASAGGFLQKMGTGLAGVISKFTDLIQRAADSGALASFFDAGLFVLHAFASLLGSVLSLVHGLLTALASAGGGGLSVLTSVIGTLATFFNSAQGQAALIGLFNVLNAAIAALGPILANVLPALGGLLVILSPAVVKIIQDLAPAFSDLAGNLARVVPVIQPFVDAVVMLVDHAGPFLDWLTRQPALITAAIAAWAGYKAALVAVAIWEAIVDGLDPLTWVVLAIVAVAYAAYEIQKHWKAISSFFKRIAGDIAGFFVWLWHAILDIGGKIAYFFTVAIPKSFEALPGRLWGYISSIPGILKAVFTEALYSAGEAIGVGIGLLIASLVVLPGRIWDALKDLAKTFADIFHAAISWAYEEWSRYRDWFGNELITLPDKIEEWLKSLPGRLGAIFKNAWQWVKDEFTKAGTWIVDFAKSLPGRIVGFFDNVGHSIYNGIKGGINSAIQGFNDGIDKIAGPLHVALPHIPKLARGGLITSPTLALVGEAGREAVIPMSSPARAMEAAQRTGLLDMLSGMMGGGRGAVQSIRVFLGTRELEDIVVQIVDGALGATSTSLATGPR